MANLTAKLLVNGKSVDICDGKTVNAADEESGNKPNGKSDVKFMCRRK